MPDQAVAAALAAAVARAVVGDGQLDVTVAVAHEHLGVLRPRMLDRVRQAFLDEPVGGEVDPAGRMLGLALDLEFDRQPHAPACGRSACRGARGSAAARAPAPPRAGGGRRPSFASPRAPRGRSARRRAAPRAPSPGGPKQPPRRGCLHGHHADAVPDDVVQLASDPRALLGDREPRPLDALSLGPREALLRPSASSNLRPRPNPIDQKTMKKTEAKAKFPAPPLRVVVGDDRRHTDPEREAGDRLPSIAEKPEQDEHRKRGQGRDHPVRDEAAVDERARARRRPPEAIGA